MTVLLLKSDVLKAKKKTNIKWFNVRKYVSLITNKSTYLFQSFKLIAFGGICYVLFTLPFNLNFKPFVSGVGVLCAPDFLIKIGKIGPFLFEANHCQRSPFWMLLILYGFFYFFATALVIKILRIAKTPPAILYTLLLILLSTILIATPEFIYAKDIYPAHYRANTMFKLGYQAFMMLSLVSSFSIAYLFHKGRRIVWLPITFVLLTLILIYPYFAVTSYFNNFKTYQGLDGLAYLKTSAPDDFDAIVWIQKNIKDQPVLLEAQGDSYTDYERISANTGLPTPLGWTVHEWLWRGSYSFPESRLEDVKNLYEGDVEQTRLLIQKYKVKYVFVGTLERTKYPNLNEAKFETLGTKVYQKGTVSIYQL
jgi:YYY domain-containing protein